MKKVIVVGGGLAGSEAAWQLAKRDVNVTLYEMRPVKKTEAHQGDQFAELVCSNSFRSDDDEHNAVGLLHHELRRAGSLIMQSADKAAVPAGSALAVDREVFAQSVTDQLEKHPNITIKRQVFNLQELSFYDEDTKVIIATGPLTESILMQEILALTGEGNMAFFDAIAPIIYKDTVDFDIAWFQSRYDKTGLVVKEDQTGDYINCPMNEQQYHDFIEALGTGDKTEFKDFEKNTPYFEACLPIEVMAERGHETLRFGPMKPVGLTNPHKDESPYAVVQLRQDNKLGTLYNMVGFQTKLKYGAQKAIFRKIPGLEKAEFARLGGIHRNSYLKSPLVLTGDLRLKAQPQIRMAGQVTGVEGYVESTAIGFLAGIFAFMELSGQDIDAPNQETAMGALLQHVTGDAVADSFQPMNINFGLMPPPPLQTNERGKRRKLKGMERKKFMTDRAKDAFAPWVDAIV